MPRTARAAVVVGAAGALEIRSYEVPEPGPGQFVLDVELCGVCGTDAHIYRGRLPHITFPVLLGHEIVGTLAALGDGVRTDYAGTPVHIGDRVGVFPALSCGTCHECQVRRRPGSCPNRRPSYGFTSPADVAPHLTGGFAETLYAANAGTVFHRVALTPEVAVLQEPMSVALHGIERGRVGLGSTVVVQGVGAIGLMAVVGAAGSPQAFSEAIGLVADGGVLAELGNFTDRGAVAINPYTDLLKRDITLAGVYGAGPDMQRRYDTSLRLLERGGLPYDRVVSHRVPLARVGEALTALDDGYSLDGRDIVKLAIDPAA